MVFYHFKLIMRVGVPSRAPIVAPRKRQYSADFERIQDLEDENEALKTEIVDLKRGLKGAHEEIASLKDQLQLNMQLHFKNFEEDEAYYLLDQIK